jgi:TonB family protein
LTKIEEKVEELYEENLEEVIVKPSKTTTEVLSDENLDLSDALIISPDLVDEVKKSTSFNKYLIRNLRYPSKAQKELITGISYIGFTVNNSGKILNIKALKEKSSILSEEVIRVLQSIENANTLNLSEPNDYVISVNFGLEVNKGNGTSELLSSEPIINFEGRKKLDDIVVMGYAENISREIKADTIYNAVDQQAEFPGGMEGFSKFLQQNIKYPASAQKANHMGKVYIQFIVNTDGSANGFDVVRSTGDNDLDNEALRVLKLVKWNPGKHKGKDVRSRFTVPVSFLLSN